MNKVTVEQFLNAGFEFVAGDKIVNIQKEVETITAYRANDINNRNGDFNFIFMGVVNLTNRKNEGLQPVADNCVVEYILEDGYSDSYCAKVINWGLGLSFSIKTWKPSLKHLEQQMNKQESAMNISERDIENAIDNVEVERVLAESDEWVNGDVCRYYNKQLQEGGNLLYVSQHPTHSDHSVVFASEEVVPFFTVPTAMLSRPLTTEQKVAKERDEWIDNVCDEICISDDYIIGLMYDAGYRK